jgi:single-stranded-DNA-specific exonuclease
MAVSNAERILRDILAARGIAEEQAVREFLSPKPQLTHDPLLLPDMGAGADFLSEALRKGRNICIYGDYDVDGVTGTALLVLFLKRFAQDAAAGGGQTQKAPSPLCDPKISYYIPSRIEEGYGLNNAALKAIRDRGAEVVVTVDCGSVSVAEVDFAKSIGLEILITDHHEMGSLVPDCLMVNPKRHDVPVPYPFPGLCGCGVAFKLACAVFDRAGGGNRAMLHELVDLVAVATVADVMPLTDENRTLVKHGLNLIRKGKRRALTAILETAEVKPENVGVRDIAFSIAPRINAVGRLGSASSGVELLLSEDSAQIRDIAMRMNERNLERRQVQEACFASCMETVRDAAGSFLLLRPAYAHEGVSGIVAGKVREATGFPCAVLAAAEGDAQDNDVPDFTLQPTLNVGIGMEGDVAESNAQEGDAAGGDAKEGDAAGGDAAKTARVGRESEQLLKASARSAGRLDLIALLLRHEEFFLKLGGHAMAAGFLIRAVDEDRLRAALCADLDALLAEDPDLLKENVPVDAELRPDEIDMGLAEAVLRMEPFGAGNPKPSVRVLARPEDFRDVRPVGTGHVRFRVGQVPCMYFRGAETLEAVLSAAKKDPPSLRPARAGTGEDGAIPSRPMVVLTGCPEINIWQGRRNLQFVIASLQNTVV